MTGGGFGRCGSGRYAGAGYGARGYGAGYGTGYGRGAGRGRGFCRRFWDFGTGFFTGPRLDPKEELQGYAQDLEAELSTVKRRIEELAETKRGENK
jgi:hypothetical protein